jgi:hypothetical protein
MPKTKPDVAATIFKIVDGGSWVTRRSQITSSNAWQVCFRHKFLKKQNLSP